MKKKYESWGEFLKKRRGEKFRSAREFCCRVSVGISYPQYSRYEAGDQLPNLEQALLLCKLLDIPIVEGLLEWCRAQINDPAASQEVRALIDKVTRPAVAAGKNESLSASEMQASNSAVSLDDVIVFNRSHLKLFASNPVYRDIFTYVNSFAPEWIAAQEIAEALELSQAKTEEMMEQLNDLGVLLVAGGKCRTTKRNFYFPDDADFFALRNDNIVHNTTSIIKKLKPESLTHRQAYRALVTRELTREQMERVILRSEDIMNEVVSMPETSNPERIFSFCMLLGERFARPQAKNAEKEKISQSYIAAHKNDRHGETMPCEDATIV